MHPKWLENRKNVFKKYLRLPLLCPTGRVRGSRPARRSGRSVKKRMNSNVDVM
jgi:hypothetical protein